MFFVQLDSISNMFHICIKYVSNIAYQIRNFVIAQIGECGCFSAPELLFLCLKPLVCKYERIRAILSLLTNQSEENVT